MSEFLIYNGKVAGLLAVFCLFYRLMERETFHRLNRAVLLLSVLASYILPACIITTHQIVRMTAPLTEVRNTEIATIQTNTQAYWPTVLLTVYLIGFAAKLLYTILSAIRLHRFISHCEQHLQKDGTMIAVSEQNLAPFSWWNTIVLSRADYETHDPALLAHEQAHIKSYHSVDVLLMELVVALQWFNPAAWLMRRDLRTVHEYEADAAVLAGNVDIHHYLSLLMERAIVSNRYTLANGISQKTLKSRFQMMARQHSNPLRLLKMLYVLPIIGCTLLLNAQTVVETKYVAPVQDHPETEQATSTSEKVSVSGTVVDEQGEPIIGAVIKVRGQTLGAVSDYDGEFSIPVPQGSTLEVMYVGFGTESFICQEDKSNLKVTLIKDNSDQ